MKNICLKLIRFYQRNISANTAPSCRFTPTCSQYTYTAIERFGVVKGILMGMWRILRCNPFSKGGYDPVPEKGLRNKSDSRTPGDSHKKCEHTDTTENEKEN